MKQRNSVVKPKTLFGFAFASLITANVSQMLGTYFMLYLTDYSGIDAALGKVGFAASFGTIVLLIGRIVDMIDDPVQSWIIDSSKPGRFGKYRRFEFIHILVCSVALSCLFYIPEVVKGNVVLVCAWVMLFYIMLEMGTACFTLMPLLRNTTADETGRTKLMKWYRIGCVIGCIPSAFFISIVTGVNTMFNDMGKSFSVTCMVVTLFFCVLSMIGAACIKENISESQEKEEKIHIKEILAMIKENKPMLFNYAGYFFVNFAWPLMSACMIYMIKWVYCADLSTGVVDGAMFAKINVLYSLCILIPNIITPFFAPMLIKVCKGPLRAAKVTAITNILCYIAILVCHWTGVLQANYMVLIGIFFILGTSCGIAVIPYSLLNVEVADYAEQIAGRKMDSIVNSLNSVIGKAQTALSTVVVGAILVLANYSVDAATDTYIGDLADIPQLQTNLTMSVTLVPMILVAIGLAIYHFGYGPSVKKMKASLEEKAYDQ